MKREWSIALALAAICICAPSQKQSAPNGSSQAAWIPPKSKLDPSYVKMAQALLGNGFGDPRSGDFCEVNVYEQAQEDWQRVPAGFKHGWVLEGGKTAVLMDGLKYPIKSVGRRIDLQGLDAAGRSNLLVDDFNFFDQDSGVAAPALFLISGHPDLAESVDGDYASGDRLSDYLFHRIMMRATQALVDKQYAVALSWARRLVQVAQVSKQQGIVASPVEIHPFSQTRLDFALDFCRDMERRSRQQPGRSAESTTDADTAHLIQNMDLITGCQVHKLSLAINYTGNPIYAALLKRGKSAVPALIDVVGQDRRFTAMFMVSGGMSQPSYTLHPVSEIAQELLTKIWPSARFCFTEDRKSTASALRKSWLVESKRSQFEQWAEVLANEDSTPREWLQAAQTLVSPRVLIQDGDRNQPSPTPSGPLEAATLRAKRGPEIGALMAKRALQMANNQNGNAFDLHTCADALSMGECLGIWSPSTSLAPLRQLSHIAQRVILKWTADQPDYGQACAEPFSRVIVCRLKEGDRSAIADLSQVIQTFAPELWFTVNELKPLWMLPHDPRMQAVAEKYMAVLKKDIVSPDITASSNVANEFVGQAINSPLLTVPSFRKMLAAGCPNSASWFEAWLNKDGYIEYCAKNSSGSFKMQLPNQGLRINEHVPVTIGDLVAQRVSSLPGAPEFCMIWPPVRRTAVKQKLIKWLLDDTRDWSKVAKSVPGYNEGD